jgi:PmbA protein
MENREVIDYCKSQLEKAGIDHSIVVLTQDENSELYFNHGTIAMFRTTFNSNLTITIIDQFKRGSKNINKLDRESIDQLIKNTIELTQSSQPDEANCISENQPKQSFESGPMEGDKELMYSRLDSFLTTAKERYPKVILEEGGISFVKSKRLFSNSNGVDFSSITGGYQVSVMFTSKDGEKTSSFNHSGYYNNILDSEIIDSCNIDQLLKESEEQVDSAQFDDKFTGEIIITPDCMGSFLGSITYHLGDFAHISNSSLFSDKMDKSVASDIFTLRSLPVSPQFAAKDYFTADGYPSENLTIIENGVLRSNLLSLYGSKKTGKKMAANSGELLAIDNGDTPLNEMIKSVKKGILLARFSGGNPNDNGDFSGVAKNSYYIEDGKIVKPVKEVMITGNTLQLLQNIAEISKESINYGYCEYPWIKVNKIHISGK